MNKFNKFLFYISVFVCLCGFNVFAQTSNPLIAKNTSEKKEEPKDKKELNPSSETDLSSKPSADTIENTNNLNRSNISFSRVGVQSTQTMPLTLNEAIRKALENNNDIEVAKNDVKIQESTLRSLLGFYDPVFTVNPRYTKNIQPQPSTLGGADISGVTESSEFRADASYFQPIKQGGGNINVFFNNSRNSTSSSFSQLNPTFNSSLGITFTQPLLRDRGIDRTRQQIKIQRKRVAQSDADFRRRSIEIISQVQRAYWDLVFALRDQQNRVANLNLTKENLRQVEAKIAAGLSAPLARAEVSTELANRESEVLTATQQVSIAENTLKQLLLRDPAAPEWTVQLVPTDTPVYSNEPIDLDTVVNDAIDNRPELRRLKLAKEINEIDLKYFKNQILPQVDFNASYSMIGLSGTPTGSTESFTTPLIAGNPNTNASAFLLQQLRILNPNIIVPEVTINPSVPTRFIGNYGQSFQNLLTNDTRNLTVGITFSFPLRNQTAKADLATAQYQKTQLEAQTRAQEQVVITEVRNAVQAVETARQRVLTARRARENAEIQLEGERKLFEVGRSTTFLLFQRENTLTNARNAEIRAETDLNKALSDLQRATSTTFQVNNIQVESPTDDQ